MNPTKVQLVDASGATHVFDVDGGLDALQRGIATGWNYYQTDKLIAKGPFTLEAEKRRGGQEFVVVELAHDPQKWEIGPLI